MIVAYDNVCLVGDHLFGWLKLLMCLRTVIWETDVTERRQSMTPSNWESRLSGLVK